MQTATKTSPSRIDAPLTVSEHHFSTWDGTNLYYRAWHPGEVQRRAVVLFHGGHEHSGRFQALAEALAAPDVSLFAWDARGHGRSPGERGWAEHFQDFVRDADCFLRHLTATYGIGTRDMVLLGHCVGSVVAATWVHDYAPELRGMVLGSPAFKVKLYVPFALTGLRLLQRLRPHGFVQSYVRPGMLTHDAEEAEARRGDSLISPQIAMPVLTSLFDTAERVIAGTGGIQVPTLLLTAGSDHVVHCSARRAFYERLGSAHKALEVYPGFYHDVFHEQERARPIAAARKFIDECFAREERRPTLPVGHNRALYQRLSAPLPWYRPARYRYALAALAMRSVGRLSAGVRLGWDSGFDSGRTLDYVYANRAQGTTALGRWLDRLYLDSPGWQGIRQRGVNLQALLSGVIAERRARGKPVHIVDVAAGPGRYLVDVLAELADPQVTALCRDRDAAGLEAGRRYADARGVTSVSFEAGDAFDRESLAALSPRPDVVIVSGLYELFEDNVALLRSLRGIQAALKPGGVLIYTNQPHHPQLAFIARTLVNREHKPWVMRPRPQAEMNAMVRQTGFRPPADAWGRGRHLHGHRRGAGGLRDAYRPEPRRAGSPYPSDVGFREREVRLSCPRARRGDE